MLLKGTIYITTDINLCLSNLNMCKTIIIADEPDNYRIPQAIGGSLLLPPYEAMTALIDGNDAEFNMGYMDYLNNNPSVYKFINIILQALIAGTNIIFLIDSEGINFELSLREFFMTSFGILIGDSSHVFSYDITYTPIILNRLYISDDISKETYLTLYPNDMDIEPFFVSKLSYEFNIILNDIRIANEYFKKYSKVLKNGGIIRDVVSRL